MEQYKFLYELSRRALDEELDRYKRVDEKASRFLSILSIGIVAYTALLNTGASKIFPLHSAGPAAMLFVALAVLTFAALLSSWFRIFCSIKLSCQDAVASARTVLTKKTGYLESAYKEIQFSTYLLGASVGVYFWIAATTIGK
jgi:hypothetical protein